MNSFIGRYHIGMRSRKWYLRIFYHLLDMTVINSWLVYKYLKRNEAPSLIVNLCHYRLELAEVSIMQLYSITNEEGPVPVTVLKWNFKTKIGCSTCST